MSNEPKSKPLNTILLYCTLGLLGWIAFTVQMQSVAFGKMESRMANLEVQTENSNHGRWTKAEMKIYSQELGHANPLINVPDPATIIHDYEN